MLIQILVSLFIKILCGKYVNWQRSSFFQRQLAQPGFLTNGAAVYLTGYFTAHNFLRYPVRAQKCVQLTSSRAPADSRAETTTVIMHCKDC